MLPPAGGLEPDLARPRRHAIGFLVRRRGYRATIAAGAIGFRFALGLAGLSGAALTLIAMPLTGIGFGLVETGVMQRLAAGFAWPARGVFYCRRSEPVPRNFESLSHVALDSEAEERLIAAQTECTFMWATREGWPLGVIMSYLARDGQFWLTTTTNRGRVAAIRRDPRVAIVITSTGTSLGHGKTVTYRGTCSVHDDEETKGWFYPALGTRRFPDDDAYRAQFVRGLDSPKRVVLEITPTQRIAVDLDKLHPGADMYSGSEPT